MERNLLDIAEFFISAVLLTIMLMITQKWWAWGYKLIFIFIGGMISGYLFSWIPAYFAPDAYASGLRTAINGWTTIISFMALVYVFEKDLLKQVFVLVQDKYLPPNDKSEWQD